MSARIVLVVLCSIVFTVYAQVNFAVGSTTYTQNFDTLANTGASNDFTTFSNWYAYKKNAAVTTYRAEKGSNTADDLKSYGAVSASDRALGILYSGTAASPGTFSVGLSMKNNDASQYITSITVSYTGEQWHEGTDTTGAPLLFAYALDCTSDVQLNYNNVLMWTQKSALTFNEKVKAGTSTFLDGNAAGNKQALSATWSVSIPPGNAFWFKWYKNNVGATLESSGLAIDDLTVTVTYSSLTPAITLNVDQSSPGTTDKYEQAFSTLPKIEDQFVFFQGFTGSPYSLDGWLSFNSASYPSVLTYAPSSVGTLYKHTNPVFTYDGTDLKLGFYPSPAADKVIAGAKFINNEVTKKLIGFDISLVFTQHYCGNKDGTTNDISQIRAYYSTNASSLAYQGNDWTPISAAFKSLANCQGHKWFDNSFKNEQQVSVSVDLTATGDEVLPGEYLLFRFISKVLDTTQTDQTLYNGMGMDDLSITFHWESGTSTSTGTSGDPHFYGFLGQKYDVMGQSFEVYNIISAPTLQINSRFTPYYKKLGQQIPTGTMMGEIGIKVPGHQIFANSNSTFVVIDDQEVNIDEQWEIAYDNGVIIRNSPNKNHKFELTVETPQVVISFLKRAYYVTGMEPQFHFDYKARMLSLENGERLHGLLGQTWEDKTFDNKPGAFKFLEGYEEDYRIISNNIFGDDFTFNQFANM